MAGTSTSGYKSVVKQRIVRFELDEAGDWRAILACGHPQHVRHQPPLVSRPWVLTEEGRASRIGHELDCKRCDEEFTPPDPPPARSAGSSS